MNSAFTINNPDGAVMPRPVTPFGGGAALASGMPVLGGAMRWSDLQPHGPAPDAPQLSHFEAPPWHGGLAGLAQDGTIVPQVHAINPTPADESVHGGTWPQATQLEQTTAATPAQRADADAVQQIPVRGAESQAHHRVASDASQLGTQIATNDDQRPPKHIVAAPGGPVPSRRRGDQRMQPASVVPAPERDSQTAAPCAGSEPATIPATPVGMAADTPLSKREPQAAASVAPVHHRPDARAMPSGDDLEAGRAQVASPKPPPSPLRSDTVQERGAALAARAPGQPASHAPSMPDAGARESRDQQRLAPSRRRGDQRVQPASAVPVPEWDTQTAAPGAGSQPATPAEAQHAPLAAATVAPMHHRTDASAMRSGDVLDAGRARITSPKPPPLPMHSDAVQERRATLAGPGASGRSATHAPSGAEQPLGSPAQGEMPGTSMGHAAMAPARRASADTLATYGLLPIPHRAALSLFATGQLAQAAEGTAPLLQRRDQGIVPASAPLAMSDRAHVGAARAMHHGAGEIRTAAAGPAATAAPGRTPTLSRFALLPTPPRMGSSSSQAPAVANGARASLPQSMNQRTAPVPTAASATASATPQRASPAAPDTTQPDHLHAPGIVPASPRIAREHAVIAATGSVPTQSRASEAKHGLARTARFALLPPPAGLDRKAQATASLAQSEAHLALADEVVPTVAGPVSVAAHPARLPASAQRPAAPVMRPGPAGMSAPAHKLPPPSGFVATGPARPAVDLPPSPMTPVARHPARQGGALATGLATAASGSCAADRPAAPNQAPGNLRANPPYLKPPTTPARPAQPAESPLGAQPGAIAPLATAAAPAPRRTAPDEDAAPTIRVSIGRIRIEGPTPTTAKAPRFKRPAPSLTLANYAQRRAGRRP